MISGSKMKASRYEILDEVANEIAERQFEYLEKAIENGQVEYFATRKIIANRHTSAFWTISYGLETITLRPIS